MARQKVEIVKKTEDLELQHRSNIVKHNLGTKNRRWFYLGILALAVVALFLANQGLLVVAVVNNRPIFSWELNQVLRSRFGKQILEGIISERLIAEAARKQGVKVSQAEIEAKTTDILKGLGPDVNIDDLLKYQGLTKEDFDNQIRLQLTVAKILGQDITISELDIDNYIASNQALLTSTDPAQMRAQAKSALLDQGIGEKLQLWFMELKDKAKIIRFF